MIKTILVTSGGTQINIDPVRHFVNWWPEDEHYDPIGLKNMSRGTFGSMIANEFLKQGHRVIFLCAKHSKRPYTIPFNARQCMTNPDYWFNFETDRFNLCKLFQSFGHNYSEIEYDTFDDYANKLELILKGEMNAFGWKPNITVLAAAASDYGVVEHTEKIRSGDALQIQMFPLPKLISRVKEWCPDTTLVGFKLLVETDPENLIEAAKKSIKANGCEMVVANDLASIRANNHTVYFVLPANEGSFQVTMRTSQEGNGDKTYLARQVAAVALMRNELDRATSWQQPKQKE